jgi:acetyl esterase/lipase
MVRTVSRQGEPWKIMDIPAYLAKAFGGLSLMGGRTRLMNPRDIPVKELLRDLPYTRGAHRLQKLDVTVPFAEPPLPILVYVHGGGWMNGDKSIYRRICALYAQAGFLVCNINYRLTPQYEFPELASDVASAVHWACDNGSRYGGDPARIFLAGDSAGAQLASWYAAALRDPALREAAGLGNMIPAESLKGLLLFYGAYDMDNMLATGFPFMRTFYRACFGKGAEACRMMADIASTARHLTREYPPAFISCGGSDPLLPESHAFSRALEELGVPHRDLFLTKPEYPRVKHGFLNFYFFKSSRVGMQESIAFLREYA